MSSTKKNLPAVFLDRDGTVIEEVEYLSDLGAIRPFPGSAEAFQTLREAGFQIVLVSNQSGVARGYFDENFVREANERIQQMLEFRFDGVYYCPHGPDDECACRKPATGLVDRAVGEMGLQRSGSFMIGDKGADIGLARASGLQAILVRTGYGKEFEGRVSADYVADDLSSACRWILSSNRKQSGR